jgi:hypothetical protein
MTRSTLRVVGVHGVNNLDPDRDPPAAAEHLASRWRTELDPTVHEAVDVDLRMAYYAPQLRILAGQGISGMIKLTEWEEGALWKWAVLLDAVPAEDAPAQARWSVAFRVFASAIAKRRSLDLGIVQPTIAHFLSEAQAYLNNSDHMVRRTVRNAVADVIRSQRPQIVIAHSLGSVVAYEALWHNPDLQVGRLITIGSPLAMPFTVVERLDPHPATGRGTRPPTVGTWINIADRGDIVAIPRPFTDWFEVDRNVDDLNFHWLDFHSVENYLRTPAVTAAILECLSVDGQALVV